MPTLGSLFDGIGGFPLAAIRNGITPLWASEIEAFPIEVTKTWFPEMRHVGDITELDGAKLPLVDIITGGSPCQDLSVAGKRAGLAGERSGLFMEQIRIIKEMRWAYEQSGRTAHTVQPRYMCWENVPGAFSSGTPNDEDFRAVLEETCRIADSTISIPRPPNGVWKPAGCILGEQFSIAWRVLDAQYWGVPQRRKRIFVIADFAGHSAHKILFEQESLFGDTAPSGGSWQGTATAVAASIGDAGGAKGVKTEKKQTVAFATNQRDEVRNLGECAAALQSYPGMKQQTFVAVPIVAADNCLTPWDTQRSRVFTPDGVSPTMTGADGGGGRNPVGLLFSAGVISKGNSECIVTPEKHTSLAAGVGQSGQGYPCFLTAGSCAGAVPTVGNIGYQQKCAPTLKVSSSDMNMVPAVLCINDQGGQFMHLSENICGTLRAQMQGHPPIVLGNQPELFENHGIDSRYTGPHEVAPTMSARYGTGGNNVPLISEKTAESYCIAGNIIDRETHNGGNGFGYQLDISYILNTADRHAVCQPYQEVVGTLCSDDEKGISNQYVSQDKCIIERKSLIRRLTPLECERLQGFPDGWTDIAGGSDSVRYKALGNSVAIPCVEFVMRGVAYFLRETIEGTRE